MKTRNSVISDLAWKRVDIDERIDEELSRLERYGSDCVCGKGSKYCDGTILIMRCIDVNVHVLVRYCTFCGGCL